MAPDRHDLAMDELVSLAIPTYQREEVLLDTISSFLQLQKPPAEILIIDQTLRHKSDTVNYLEKFHQQEKIRWIRLSKPSIPNAMNIGLREATYDIVLFADDDIVPGSNLVEAHARAQKEGNTNIVAGQVLQPGEQPLDQDPGAIFRFCSKRRQFITGLMAGNFSIKRDVAIRLGGFDENFVRVAYRFETEFAERAVAAGEKILFEPDATIYHLKHKVGGTRSYGEHLTTLSPGHSVGAYYYFLRSKMIKNRSAEIISRLFGSIVTKYHLHHPWWMPVTFVSETLGLLWAMLLTLNEPKLIPLSERVKTQQC